jgi:large repetitive protein
VTLDYSAGAVDADVAAGCSLLVPAGPAAAGGATFGAAATDVPLRGTGGIADNGENADPSASIAADVVADAGASDIDGASDSTDSDACAVPAGTSGDDPIGAACAAAAGAPAGMSADGTADAGATVVASGAAEAAGAEPPVTPPAVATGAEAADAAPAEATDAALLATGCEVVST